MDLLKLKIIRTDNEVGKWRSYDVIDMPGIEAVLVKADSYPLTLDIVVIEDSSGVSNVCTAKFLELGPNKINVIKAVREVINWGLRESKDFVENFPRTLTVKDGLTKQGLNSLVHDVNNAGGRGDEVEIERNFCGCCSCEHTKLTVTRNGKEIASIGDDITLSGEDEVYGGIVVDKDDNVLPDYRWICHIIPNDKNGMTVDKMYYIGLCGMVLDLGLSCVSHPCKECDGKLCIDCGSRHPDIGERCADCYAIWVRKIGEKAHERAKHSNIICSTNEKEDMVETLESLIPEMTIEEREYLQRTK